MFENYEECVEVIMSRKNRTYGNDRLKDLLDVLGNPHLNLKTIHVGGTNGKGSTTNYLAHILQSAGYNVGTFTSPHLIEHRDRIRINGTFISSDDFLRYVNMTLPYWEEYELSMFDIDFLISVYYFLEHKVDYVIYEVGLGGLLDTTNVIKPLVSIITNIGLDHTQILGNTIEEIAHQKAGIIKAGIPLFTTETNQNIIDIFTTYTNNIHVIKEPNYFIKDHNLYYNIDNYEVCLGKQAVYQVNNSYLAYCVTKYLFPDMKDRLIITSIEEARWAGRFEEVVDNVYLDGAHNLEGIHQLIKSLAVLEPPICVVFSALNDKPYLEMIKELEPYVDKVIVTTFDFDRVYDLDSIPTNNNIIVEENYKRAIDIAQRIGNNVIISGSLYFVSIVRAYLLKNRSLL